MVRCVHNGRQTHFASSFIYPCCTLKLIPALVIINVIVISLCKSVIVIVEWASLRTGNTTR